MGHAIVRCAESGTFVAGIGLEGFDDVWGHGPDADSARADLRDVVLEWLELKVEDGDRDIPVIDASW
jgi:hypothetical protein